MGKEKMKGTECNLQARGWRDWCRQGGKQRAFCPLTCLSSAPYRTCWDFRLPTLLPTCVAASLSILLPPTPQPPLQPAASLFPGPHNLDSDGGHGPSCFLRTGLGPFFFSLLISQQNLSSVAHLECGMVVAGARVGFPSLLDLCTVPWNYPLDLVCVLVTQSCRLIVTSRIIAHQAPLSMEFSRQEYWSGFPFPSPGDLPNLGIKPGSPALQADFLLSEPPGKPQ